MFQRKLDGIEFRFHLAGINNQNFLMRDEQTGTYWQQITGQAVSGPLAGRQLQLVSSDELSFALWKQEQPNGTVLKDVPAFVSEYAGEKWDVEMARMPTVISFTQTGLKPRTLMIGVHLNGLSRAFPYTTLLKEKLIQDRVGDVPVLVVLGPDNQSLRVFERRVPGETIPPEFYRLTDKDPHALLMDSVSGSQWNFQGCATAGKWQGVCLAHVEAIKDYWFDWRNYNPDTTVYGVKEKIR